MANTPNKDLEKPAHGSEVNTWDQPVNDNSDKMDSAFGGSLILNAATLGPATIPLTVGNVTPPTIIVTGAPAGDLVYTVPNGVGGNWIISNGTTGNKVISFLSLAGGSAVIIPAGINTLISCDGTNRGMVYSSQTDPADRPLVFIGTRTANNTSPTLEWTGLGTTYSNYLLVIDALRPSSANAGCFLQFGEGVTPTWQTSGYYGGGGVLGTATSAGAPTPSPVAGNNLSGALINQTQAVTNNSLLGINGKVDIFNLLSNSGMVTSLIFATYSSSVIAASPIEGRTFTSGGTFLNDTTPKTGVRLVTSDSSNWLNGEATLFAYRLT